MMADLYRLKASLDEGKHTITHEGREWVFANVMKNYSADTEILIDTEGGREVVLFADLDEYLETEGVWLI